MLLVPTHAGAEGDVNTRWYCEAKAFGDLGQIQLIDIKNTAQRVRGVGVKVAAVTILGTLVQIVV